MPINQISKLFSFLIIAFIILSGVSCGGGYQVKDGVLSYTLDAEVYGFGSIEDIAEINVLSSYQALLVGIDYKINLDDELELELNSYSGTLMDQETRQKRTNGQLENGIYYVKYPIQEDISHELTEFQEYKWEWRENAKNSDLFWLSLGDFFTEIGLKTFHSGDIYIIDLKYSFPGDGWVKMKMKFLLTEDKIE